MPFENAYFINGTAYAGKSTMVKLLAEKHGGIACEENYHDAYDAVLDPVEFPCLCYTRDLRDWRDFIRRSPEEYEAWYDGVSRECEILELRMLPDICRRGIIPVAAHLERYIGFNNSRMLSRFTALDILVQCNAEFFLSRRSARKALSLLRDGRIHFLGTDAHNTNDRAPNLGPALELIRKKLGDAALERLRSIEGLIDEGRGATDA